MTADPNHTANSFRVAQLLAPVLLENGGDRTWYKFIDHLTDNGWHLAVAEAARRDYVRFLHDLANTPDAYVQDVRQPWKPRKGYLPSESTKRLIALMIRAETAPTPTTDPFAGLPGVDD